MKTRMKIVAAAVAIALCLTAQAQWMTQRIPLVKGWNAVHLKVKPANAACSAVFSNNAITQVAWWNRDRLDDGTGSAISDFCYWYRDGSVPSAFGRVVADQRYLVYCASGPFNLDVVGVPVLPSGTIYSGESNLVGLNVPYLTGTAANSAPTYYEYFFPLFGRSPQCYSVTTANESLLIGAREKVANASAAVWVKAPGDGVASFTGPFAVSLDRSAPTVAWTDNDSPRTITIRNVSGADRVLTIERTSSLTPPSGQGSLADTPNGGLVALLGESINWADGYPKRVFNPLAFPLVTNLAAGATFELRIRPNLAQMPKTTTGDYMSILNITDKGSTIDGVKRTEGTALYRVGLKSAGALADNSIAAAAGLWVGTVVLDRVSRAKTLGSANPEWDPDQTVTAPHPFTFRLLVHVTPDGTAKILKQVFIAKKSPDADASELLTDRASAIAYRERNPNATIRRTASANFPFVEPLALTGGKFMTPDTTLSATFTQAYDDKTNPFVHSFHPQHDNVQFTNQKPSKMADGDEGRGEYESWGVTRTISLGFLAADPADASGADWNRTVTGGTYEEKVQGLNGTGKPIFTSGIFRLSKVNDTGELK